MLLQARSGASARERPGPARWSFGALAETWIVVGLVVLAAVLRFATLSDQSYWLDESQAAHELAQSFGGMLHGWNVAEWNPPLYLIVAWPWAKVFGTGAAGLRSLAAILGVGLVPLLYLCGRELVSARAGVIAAGLAAVNPFMIDYSREAREYMLLVVLCTASLLFFARAWRRGSSRDLIWWAVFSALALLTQYFAGFLTAAEGLLLVYRLRSRAGVVALGAQAVVLAPFVPHVIPRLTEKAAFITDQGLATRIQQVPVAFGLNTLFKSPAVSYGLLGAAALAAVVIALLIIGADERQLRGAGLAALLAGSVLLIPLLLALVGHDDYLARGLMPAWPPLAVLVAAACAAPGAKLPGAALVGVLVAAFLWAGFKINSDAYYQRPDWRDVAAALGSPTGTRAIVAYDGQFATGPLSVYLRGIPWSGPGETRGTDAGPATISELDVVGDRGDVQAALPPGVSKISGRDVDGYLVYRFKLAGPWRADPAQINDRALRLLPGQGTTLPPMIQRASA
ncbi:MAG: glycosyltransferase family 39 protein [Solirubrobacteraceae bacterium]